MKPQERAERYARIIQLRARKEEALLKEESEAGLLTDNIIKVRNERIERIKASIASPEARLKTWNKFCKVIREGENESLKTNKESVETYESKSTYTKFMEYLTNKMTMTKEDVKDAKNNIAVSEEILSLDDDGLLEYIEKQEMKKYPTPDQIKQVITDKENPTIEDALSFWASAIATSQQYANVLTQQDKLTKGERQELDRVTNIISQDPAELFETLILENENAMEK